MQLSVLAETPGVFWTECLARKLNDTRCTNLCFLLWHIRLLGFLSQCGWMEQLGHWFENCKLCLVISLMLLPSWREWKETAQSVLSNSTHFVSEFISEYQNCWWYTLSMINKTHRKLIISQWLLQDALASSSSCLQICLFVWMNLISSALPTSWHFLFHNYADFSYRYIKQTHSQKSHVPNSTKRAEVNLGELNTVSEIVVKVDEIDLMLIRSSVAPPWIVQLSNFTLLPQAGHCAKFRSCQCLYWGAFCQDGSQVSKWFGKRIFISCCFFATSLSTLRHRLVWPTS